MSLDTQIELLGAAIAGWIGYTIGTGVHTGDWSLCLWGIGGVCMGVALSERKKRPLDVRERSEE